MTCNLQYGTPAAGWEKRNRTLTVRGFRPPLYQARAALLAAAQELEALKPDILLIQEVDMFQARSGNLNQVAYLADVLQLNYCHYAPIFSGHIVGIHRKPHPSFLPNKRGYGLALFSRFPLERTLSLPLPGFESLPDIFPSFERQTSIIGGTLSYSKNLVKYSKGRIKNQPRIVQGAVINTPLGTLAIGNTHLETQHRVARNQTRLAWQSLCDLDAEAYLLAGDFNLTPKTVDSALAVLPENQRPDFHYSAKTFPAASPRHPLDQLLASGLQARGAAQTQRLSISDHLAVIYDLSGVENE